MQPIKTQVTGSELGALEWDTGSRVVGRGGGSNRVSDEACESSGGRWRQMRTWLRSLP